MQNIKSKIIIKILLFIMILNSTHVIASGNNQKLLNPSIIKDVNTNKKLVALTFDDGPDPSYTNEILDILKKYDSKATFFVVGENVKKYPYILKREIKEGHEIGNHTFSHPELIKLTSQQTDKEIKLCTKTIEEIEKTKISFFRPPKGLYNKESLEVIKNNGYKEALWGICVEHKKSKTIQDMAKRIIQKRKPGLIILAHDGRLDRTKTVKTLPLIIEAYKKDGYKFVTLSELMKHSTIN